MSELRERFAAYRERLRIAEAIHYKVDAVNSPVDEHAAAGDRLGGECAADSGDGAMAAEVYEYMVYLSELTAHDAAANLVY